jgi:drug/metabolite transporter (DMT)-like permease
LLLGAFGIACAAIFVRLALPAPPVVTGFWRLALATAVLAVWLAPRAARALREPRPGRGRAAADALAAGACFGADLALWNTALVETSVATATLLVNTTPAFVGAFAVLVRGERLARPLVAGGALALAGAALLVGDDLDASASLRGDALSLGAAVFYSAYLLWIQRARRVLDAPAALALSGVASTLVLGAAALLRGDPFVGFPPHSWAVFAAAAAISQLAGVLGIVWALAHLSATFAAVALLAQPVGTAVLAWWWLGEGLTPLEALGGLAVIAGIALAARARRDGDVVSSSVPPTTGRAPADRSTPSS